jgi:DNA polymerase-3 subunit alpha
MTGMLDSLSKISLYTKDCKKNGIKILPPSVNYSETGFTPQGKNIRFGLMAIKNLGAGLIDRLIAEREKNGLYTSMYDFCYRNFSREFNRKALEGLIKSGALDGLENNRRQMLYNIDGVLDAVAAKKRFAAEGQLNLFDEDDDFNTYTQKPMEEMSEELKLELEKEATGLFLSGHPMDKFASLYTGRTGIISIGDIIEGKIPDGKRVQIAGIISDLKSRNLKNGSILASCTVEDTDGAIPVTIFAKAYSEFRYVLTANSPVILWGKVTEREDRDTELILEKAEIIPENLAQTKAEPTQKKIPAGLYIKLKSMDCPEFNTVKEILAKHKGNMDVYIYCADQNRKLKAPDALKVNGEVALVAALSQLLGAENVKIV